MKYLPTKDSATWRAGMTVLQTLVGFVVGLFWTIWQTPDVPQNVTNYVINNLPTFLAVIGLPAGLTSLIIGLARPSVKNF